jgi:transcriptional regulator with XRE-family HTH domain
MLDLTSIGQQIAERRKKLKFSQLALAHKAGISRATVEALENARAGELGFSKITKLLAVLGLELKLQTASSYRPTLDELLKEDRNDQSLDRRRSGGAARSQWRAWQYVRLLACRGVRARDLGVDAGEA